MALPEFNKIWQENKEKINSEIDPNEQFNPISSNLKRKNGIFFGPRDGFNGDFLLVDEFQSSSEYSCCNQTFSNYEQLSRHKEEHVNCSFLDCNFSAHAKLVEFHETHQHRNNLYTQISQTDLEKWRQERRKNFPTINKINQNKEIKKAKIARGEIIEQKSFSKFGKNRRNPPGSNDNPSMQRSNFNSHRNNKHEGSDWRAKRTKRAVGLAYEHPKEDPLSCFFMTSESVNNSVNEISENDDQNVLHNETVVEQSSKPSALSLLAAYDDSNDSDEDAPTENSTIYNNSIENASTDFPSQNLNLGTEKVVQEFSASNCNTTNTDVTSKESVHNPSNRSNKLPLHPVVRLQKRRQTYLNDFRMYLKRPRLLEMLLASDIRHERNIIMQCVRYVCDRDYFGVADKQIENAPVQTRGNEKHYDNDETWDGVL